LIKQLLHIFLSGFLLLGTAGLVVSKHYSNGELYSSSLFGEAEPCCADDEMCSCCSTETEFFQVEDDFISTSFQLPVMVCLQSFISPMNEISESQKTSFTFTSPYSYLSHAPPEDSELLSFIQVFLI